MKKNIGKKDKMIRLVIALVLALLVYFNVLVAPYVWPALIIAAILAVTSALNFCGLYALLGKSTCEIENKS
jgi:hypothetical protein